MMRFYNEELLATHSTPKLEDHTLLAVHDCYPPYWRPFLHLQPEDRPCCGERGPFMGHGPIPEHYQEKDPTVNSAHYGVRR